MGEDEIPAAQPGPAMDPDHDDRAEEFPVPEASEAQETAFAVKELPVHMYTRTCSRDA